MKYKLWFLTILIFGLLLLACSAVEPTAELSELQAGETAVATTPSPSTETPPPSATLPTTPLPTNSPSPTPQYTVTPTPRPTQIPSPTPIPPAPEHLQMIAAGQPLPINHDLLFLSEGELRLWQPQAGQIQTLLTSAGNLAIDGWRMTPDKQTILIAQTHGEDSPGFTLFLFDTTTRQMQELWSEADAYLFAYDLARDGRSTAIITSTISYSEEDGQEIITIIDNAQKQTTMLANCANRRQKSYEDREIDYPLRCQAVAAVPNSDTWLWRDIEGVWQGGLNTAPRLLVSHDFFEDSDPPLIFSPTRDWSPNGRYQLLSARRFEGGSRWLLDMETGQTAIVENSNFGIDPGAIWQWTQDNRLLTIPPPNGNADVVIGLWHVEGVQLIQDAVQTLPNPDEVSIVTLSQLPDGRIALIFNSSGPNLGTISLISGFATPPQLLTTLPPLEKWWFAIDHSLTWSPDSAGAIYLLSGSQGQQPFYLPADGTVLYNLTEVLGIHITQLTWLP